MWGTCVHFGEASVPFAPVAGALRAWFARAEARERAEVLSGAAELSTLLLDLGIARSSERGRLLPLIDLVFDRLADRAPTVLVIDDLQWADRTSLDVLAYLLTGFGDRRLAMVATCRDENRGEGHPLHGWLADMRRLPGFTDIHLDRLNLTATEVQIEGLLGRAVDLGFAAELHERSGGNPYLTELLVRGLGSDESTLPSSAPAELRGALLASWHGMSATARRATRVLAVGGRPRDFAILADVAGEHGVDPALLSGCLTEARDHGVVRLDGQGRAWFRHPLLADVLCDDVPPSEAAAVHATYVRVLESRPGGAPERTAADLALHNYQAGRLDEAFRWSVAAADRAAELHATAEEAIHLQRACSLWNEVSPGVRDTSVGRLALVRRTSGVCGRAGQRDSSVALAEQALTMVDPDNEPLLTSTLLLEWWKATYRGSAPGGSVPDQLVEAVRLTDAFPDSPERGLTLAALACAEDMNMLHDDAVGHAAEAVRAAQRSGSELALAAAVGTRAFVHRFDFAATALADALEAVRLARSCGSTDWLEDAAIWQVSCLQHLGRHDEAILAAREAFHEVLADGSQGAYFLASKAADGLLWRGRWNECRELLRTALAGRCSGMPGAAVRLTAAKLAARSGRTAEAELHLDRAMELITDDFAGLRDDLSIAGADVYLASGQPRKALQWLHSRIVPPDGHRPALFEDLLVDVARAAAEASQAARDAGDPLGAARVTATLEELIGRWPTAPFTTPRSDVADAAMAKALFEAEVARCQAEGGQAALWREATDKCHAAGFPWEEAVSRVRCAEAMLADGSPRSAVTDLLRLAHATAVELGARPLQQQIESLARMTRITLRQPTPIAGKPRLPAVLASLTAREQQILTFLVAGRSNREIAEELVISDKTVSVHVTNILRKTGTSTRVEAATLAERSIAHRDG